MILMHFNITYGEKSLCVLLCLKDFNLEGDYSMDRIEERIKIVKDEIINIKVDAIINPTDEYFSGNDGLDKLIQKSGGEKLTKKLSKMGRCKVGQSVITKGYNLGLKSIIHTSTPKYSDENESELLYSCYRNSIELAVENENVTIAIPSISSGENKFPIEEAANIAYYAAWKMIKKYSYDELEKIYFSCTNKNIYEIYRKLSEDYKDIEFSLEMIEQYKKMDKFKSKSMNIDDFIKSMDVENVYSMYLLKEAFLDGDIEIKYIEESVKVLKEVFLHMKNRTKIFNDKIYMNEIDKINEILKEIFNVLNYETIERAEKRTKQYFVHASDYIFEKMNNSFRY